MSRRCCTACGPARTRSARFTTGLVDVWEYRAERPEEAAIFDAAMTGFSRRVNAAVAEAT
jgi:hypothetical protein